MTLRTYTEDVEHARAIRAFTNYVKAVGAVTAFKVPIASELAAVDPFAAELYRKSAQPAFGTSEEDALLGMSGAWADVMVRDTLLGRLNPLPVRPFRRMPRLDEEPLAAWIGGGSPVPVTSFGVQAGIVTGSVLGVIVGLVNEWLRDRSLTAQRFVERHLMRAVRLGIDRAVLDDQAAQPNRPAGLLHGLVAVGGGSPASLESDLEALWATVEFGEPDAPVFITSGRGAMYLAALHRDGTPMFPRVGPLGGDIAGVPLLISRAAGPKLILIDSAKLGASNEGVIVEASGAASVVMADDPTTPSTMVSGFQTNTTFLQAKAYVSWLLGSDRAVSFVLLPIAGSPA